MSPGRPEGSQETGAGDANHGGADTGAHRGQPGVAADPAVPAYDEVSGHVVTRLHGEACQPGSQHSGVGNTPLQNVSEPALKRVGERDNPAHSPHTGRTWVCAQTPGDAGRPPLRVRLTADHPMGLPAGQRPRGRVCDLAPGPTPRGHAGGLPVSQRGAAPVRTRIRHQPSFGTKLKINDGVRFRIDTSLRSGWR